jgi:hypothetical protein
MILITESGCSVVKSQGHLGNAGQGDFSSFKSPKAPRLNLMALRSQKAVAEETLPKKNDKACQVNVQLGHLLLLGRGGSQNPNLRLRPFVLT